MSLAGFSIIVHFCWRGFGKLAGLCTLLLDWRCIGKLAGFSLLDRCFAIIVHFGGKRPLEGKKVYNYSDLAGTA